MDVKKNRLLPIMGIIAAIVGVCVLLYKLDNEFFTKYVFYYPLVMSVVWALGGIHFYLKEEKKNTALLKQYPMVSFIIPCYNEEETIGETIARIAMSGYPNFEVIAVNDGSSDGTARKLMELATRYPELRVIDLWENRGKGNALFLATIASNGEYLITLDADAYPNPGAVQQLVNHFMGEGNERVGAVTGNPRIRNRNTLLAAVQLCEFSSIIGLIKRAQRNLDIVFTISGVFAAFRKRALLDCGMWDRSMITEDIGVTWRLQRAQWEVKYEPRALCWMLVPETIKGFWKQRVRWAQGGMEVLFEHWNVLFKLKDKRLVPLYLEQCASIIWSFAWICFVLKEIVEWIFFKGDPYITLWAGCFLALLCSIQCFIGMSIETKYEKKFLWRFIFSIWYPVLFWTVNTLVVVRAVPKAIKSRVNNTEFAVWESPDRGRGI